MFQRSKTNVINDFDVIQPVPIQDWLMVNLKSIMIYNHEVLIYEIKKGHDPFVITAYKTIIVIIYLPVR